MTTDGFSIFPQMPELHLDPTERRAAWLTAVGVLEMAVLAFFGPVPAAVPLMAWWTAFAAINEERIA